jgi:hypothetical protein
LALPVTGELSGTWGDTVNNSITALLDSAVAGTTTLSADADVTLTTTTLAANQAREAIILWTAGGTVTRNITAPAQSKTYVVLNKTSSTQSIVIRGVGPTTGVTVLAGKQAMVAWDGTDFVEVSSGYVDGPASSTDNAVARFDGTDGKTIQNSVVTIADTTGNMAGVGTLGVGAITTTGALVGTATQSAFNTVSTTLNLGGAATAVNIGAATGTLTVANATLAAKAVTATSITNSALTATRLVYSGTAGLEVDSANLTFNGTDLTVSGAVNAGSINATTLDLTNLEVTNIKAKDGTASIALADTTGIATFSKATRISTTDNTNAALRITQLGTGNALLVEDSTNPDASPFVIDTSGKVAIGATTATENLNLVSDGRNFLQLTRASTDAFQSVVSFRKSKGTNAVPVIVANNDAIGDIQYYGYDGTQFIQAAGVQAEVDGTPGTNDMPGRLVFLTTADGASSPTERMRIDSAGNVGIGGTPSADLSFVVSKTITGATTAYGIVESGTVQSDVTVAANMFLSNPKTVASAFTLTTLSHYSATQGTIGATSSVTNQFGFNAAANNTGATNNYGFYSAIAAGTGRWNFYANGTAANYFAGNTIISVTDNTNAALRITQLGTGNALLVEDSANPDSTPFVIDASGKVAIGATTATENLNMVSDGRNFFRITRASTDNAESFISFRKARGTNAVPVIVASGDAIGTVQYQGYDGTAFIQAATIESFVDGTPGTNDMPGRLVFSTTADGASSQTERMRIDSAGNVGIGTAANASAILDVQSTTKGVRMPNMTTTQKNAIASPAAGLMVFDTTLAKLCVYTGAAWQTITSI